MNKKRKWKKWKIMDLSIPIDLRIKLKESQLKDKYLDLARELKKTMEHKGDNWWLILLVQSPRDYEIWGLVETTQTTGLLRKARILRRVLETWGDLLSLKLQWKTIT